MIDSSKYLIKDYKCKCGKTHNVSTKKIVIGKDETKNISRYIDELDLPKNVFVVFDENTFDATGKEVLYSLRKADINQEYYIFNNKDIYHPNEKSIGTLMMAMEPIPELIIAVGSGTINDLSRFCATRLKIPYLVIATAPSMDGYASNVIPVTQNGLKITYKGIAPEMIIADLEVVKKAPKKLVAAGFGDIVGKVPANMDWQFGSEIFGEEKCPEIEELMNSAVVKCIKSATGLNEGKLEAFEGLTEALVMSGIAMQMQGNSRPASGAEHHMSHFLEMRDGNNNRPGAYHGAKVGITTLISMKLYEIFFKDDPPAQKSNLDEKTTWTKAKIAFGEVGDIVLCNRSQLYISRGDWDNYQKSIIEKWDDFIVKINGFKELRNQFEKILKECSGAVSPQDLGYTKDDILDAIIYGRLVRNRITILEILANWGLLEQYALEIVEEIF